MSSEIFYDLDDQAILEGKTLIPRWFAVHVVGDDGEPEVMLEADLVKGHMVCTRLEAATKPGTGITGAWLRNLNPDRIIDETTRYIARQSTQIETSEDGHGGRINSWAGVWDRTLENSEKKALNNIAPRRGRRPLPESHFQAVAKVYALDQRVETVQDTFHTSFSSAARWVRQAREKGLIPVHPESAC